MATPTPTTAPTRGHSHSHSHSTTNLPPSSTAATKSAYRSSVDTSNPPPSAGGRWPRTPSGVRPASEMLNPNSAAGYGNNLGAGLGAGLNQPGNNAGGAAFASSPETEAIDRWFEDLQHYESTLEEMATASLDANFKEELSAIEQWFRVLSEAERTAALYSLLQSSTQVQMRFFITVLQQMARNDPLSALLSPANPGQVSMEAQMETKLHSLGLKAPSPSSPASSARQFSRQSLGAPTTAHKANARISAPANLLGKPGGVGSGNWREDEPLVEGGSDGRRSVSPANGGRPKSTSSVQESYPTSAHFGQHLSQSTGPASTASFAARSSAGTAKDDDFATQLSPLVGGNWASMVSTPVIPMFSNKKAGEDDAAGGEDGGEFGNESREEGEAHVASGGEKKDGFVLDDVRKFRRSARISSGGNIDGGALSGMYEQVAQQQQQQQQQQRRAVSGGGQLNSAQQNAINLGLNGLQQYASSPNLNNNINNNSPTSPNLIAAQHAAVAAQQNWRNGLSSPGLVPSMSQLSNAALNNTGSNHAFGQNLTPNHLSLGFPSSFANLSPNTQQSFNSSSSNNNNINNGSNNSPLSANAQLANLFALQQQMMQQQQLQQLAAMSLTPVQMMGFQQQQQSLLSPGGRLGMGMGAFGMGAGGAFGMGGNGQMNGMASPRRSPRPSDRSPGGTSAHSNSSKTNLPSTTGSGTNPEEELDMSLIKDIPAWLRSLRLHKYTKEFEGIEWKEMVLLDEKKLEERGVNALGARRKLLKVFETVRSKTGLALPGDGANNASTTSTIAAGGSTSTSSSGSPDNAQEDRARMPDVQAAAGSVSNGSD